MPRRRALAGLLAGAAALALPLRPAAASQQTVTRRLVDGINAFRAANGLTVLPEDHHLSRVSAGWSVQMASHRALSHNPDDEAQYGWPVQGAGEIVGYIGDQRLDDRGLASRLLEMWQGSPSHRRVMLEPAWTDVGAGWAVAADGKLYGTVNFVAAETPALGQEALGLSRELVADGSARSVVISHSDLAADALTGSALADGSSPVLFTRPDVALGPSVAAEIARVSTSPTRVYLVGGRLSRVIEDQVRQAGATPVRLTGASRYDTAALVAAEVAAVRGRPDRVYLARADAWADAVSVAGHAAAHGSAVLLVDRNRVPGVARAMLSAFAGAERVVIGGREVVSDAVTNELGAHRLAGTDRSATGAEVLRRLWRYDQADPPGHLVVTPGWTADGWATALAHTTYAARHRAPLLFAAADGAPPPVREVLDEMGYTPATTPTVRFSRHVSGWAREDVQRLTAQ